MSDALPERTVPVNMTVTTRRPQDYQLIDQRDGSRWFWLDGRWFRCPELPDALKGIRR